MQVNSFRPSSNNIHLKKISNIKTRLDLLTKYQPTLGQLLALANLLTMFESISYQTKLNFIVYTIVAQFSAIKKLLLASVCRHVTI